VLSVSADWDAAAAEVRTYERSEPAAAWKATGPAVGGSLGASGLAWGRGLHPPRTDGPTKKEGDGRSPAGIFDLTGALGYAAEAPPDTRLPYQVETPTLRCVDDPASVHYNRIVDEAKVAKDWSSAEDMRRPDELYRLVVVVGHNDAPVTPGGGSCIFLHLRASPTSTTSGCTAFDAGPMESLLRWLDPAKRPVLVQLPRTAYDSLRKTWALP
jgi:L,D-peptidoglycan transpeptidase YkuD (ErfK/YbiS/YcfS/YnhG family)